MGRDRGLAIGDDRHVSGPRVRRAHQPERGEQDGCKVTIHARQVRLRARLERTARASTGRFSISGRGPSRRSASTRRTRIQVRADEGPRKAVYTKAGGEKLAANPLYDFVFLNLEGAYDADAIKAMADGLRASTSAGRKALIVRIPSIDSEGCSCHEAARERGARSWSGRRHHSARDGRRAGDRGDRLFPGPRRRTSGRQRTRRATRSRC